MSTLSRLVSLYQVTNDHLVRTAFEQAILLEMFKASQYDLNQRTGAAWPELGVYA